ncbi:MAG: methionyl-tRNA formyltransferase, partial [Chthonomonadales bacterium]
DFAVPSLIALANHPQFRVLAVVTQPDRPHGRGKKMASSPVKKTALELGLPLLQPDRVRNPEFVETIRTMAPDAIALASFGQIIPRSVLQIPPLGPINLHGSLLPKYRGAAPIQYAILNGEMVTGVTTMWMEPTLDTGDILLTESLEIGEHETAGELTIRISEAGAPLLMKTLLALKSNEYTRTKQDESLATYAPSINLEDCRVDWNRSAKEIDCYNRAMNPRPGAFSEINGKRIKLWTSIAFSESVGQPGVITGVDNLGIDVCTGSGTLKLLEVQFEGSRRMNASDWARGARVTSGIRFGAE